MAKTVDELREQLRGFTLDKGVRKMFELILDNLEDAQERFNLLTESHFDLAKKVLTEKR